MELSLLDWSFSMGEAEPQVHFANKVQRLGLRRVTSGGVPCFSVRRRRCMGHGTTEYPDHFRWYSISASGHWAAARDASGVQVLASLAGR